MKKFAVLIFFALLSGGLTRANDIYLAQNSAGAGDGSSCGNAKAVSFFNSSSNWGTGSSQIGPGDTVHLCGTISAAAGSTALTFQGSGTSGSPITLLFEAGAGLTAPYWSAANGGININGRSYLTIDGGSNGYINTSQNGSSLANKSDTKSLFVGGCTGCVIKNLTISNMYVHTSGTSGGNSYGIYLYGGNNNTVTDNTIHDGRWCVFYIYPGGSTTSNNVVSDNTIYNCDHAITAGDGNSSATLTNFTISGNTIHDMVNWDESTDSFHHDYVHVWAVGGSSTITGLQIFNNYFYGDPGQNNTALVNIETQSGNTNDGALVYNNVLTNSSSSHLSPYGYISSGGTNISLYNNTIVGSSTSQSIANECFYLGGKNYKVVNNTCQNVGLFLYLGTNGSVSQVDRNNWYNGGGFYAKASFLSLSAWKLMCLCDTNSTTSNPNLDGSFKPSSSSSLLKAASNLASLGVSNLNKDKALQARPSSSAGNWDIGAYGYGSSSSATTPNAPTGLTASVQ